jgi:hypothetical protein
MHSVVSPHCLRSNGAPTLRSSVPELATQQRVDEAARRAIRARLKGDFGAQKRRCERHRVRVSRPLRRGPGGARRRGERHGGGAHVRDGGDGAPVALSEGGAGRGRARE